VVAPAAVLVAAASVYLVRWALVGFPLAGLVAAGGYGLLVAGFFTMTQVSLTPLARDLDHARSEANRHA